MRTFIILLITVIISLCSCIQSDKSPIKKMVETAFAEGVDYDSINFIEPEKRYVFSHTEYEKLLEERGMSIPVPFEEDILIVFSKDKKYIAVSIGAEVTIHRIYTSNTIKMGDGISRSFSTDKGIVQLKWFPDDLYQCAILQGFYIYAKKK